MGSKGLFGMHHQAHVSRTGHRSRSATRILLCGGHDHTDIDDPCVAPPVTSRSIADVPPARTPEKSSSRLGSWIATHPCMRSLLGASLFALAATLPGCAGETDGASKLLGCANNTCTKAPARRDGEATTDPAETPGTDPNSNVARPVTPATPPGTTVVGAPAASPAPPAVAPPPPAPFVTKAITRRYSNGDHLFTRDPNEAPEWTLEGQPFLVFDAVHPDTQPLYRCLAGSQHFVTNDAGCEGQTFDGGVLGWLSSAPGADRFELVRCRNATGSDHLASTREECAGAGYVVEGILGYAQRPQ